MSGSLPIWLALLVALTGVMGALGSQLVSAFASLRMKRLELSYVRRASAYEDFMRKAASFAHDPSEEQKYVEYLLALEVALIHSSDDVAKALGKQGINVVAQRLRVAEDFKERQGIQVRDWYDAMKSVINAMRDDLRRVSRS